MQHMQHIESLIWQHVWPRLALAHSYASDGAVGFVAVIGFPLSHADRALPRSAKHVEGHPYLNLLTCTALRCALSSAPSRSLDSSYGCPEYGLPGGRPLLTRVRQHDERHHQHPRKSLAAQEWPTGVDIRAVSLCFSISIAALLENRSGCDQGILTEAL